MTQGSGVSSVVFLNNNSHPVCVAGQGRKKGGKQCVRCGVNKPIPLARWLKKLSWADGAQFLFEHAELLGRIVPLCVNQGWVENISPEVEKDWLFDELNLSILTLTNAEYLTVSVGKRLMGRFDRIAKRKGFFSHAYRGILQEEVLDCARRISIELWRDGARPDITLRPGGEYYTYLHSLCAWTYEMKKSITLADLCKAVDIGCPDEVLLPERRTVFAFCLMREYARRLNRNNSRSSGIPRSRQELILEFIERAAE